MWRFIVGVMLVATMASSIACSGHVGSTTQNIGKGDAGSDLCSADLPSLESTVFRSCTVATCHNATDRAASLVLEGDDLEAQLVGAGAGTCEGWTRVVPGDPDHSLLYAKLGSSPPCGVRMPVVGHMDDAELECVRAWISSLSAPTAPDGGGLDDAPSLGDGCSSCSGAAGCVDLARDSANCGACGRACPSGTACVGGVCDCGAGLTACGSTCVDTKTTAAHCGDCGRSCAAGTSCVGGNCVCSGGLLSCGDKCVDGQGDAQNCGMCGRACPTGATCSGGTCDCASGTTLCNGACVPTASDAKNCGTCGHACAANEVCNAGTCSTGCGALTQCGSSCVNTATSSSNCGVCGKACPTGATCSGGTCMCPAGTADCGGVCTSVTTNLNCGMCGRACSGGTSCVNATCACATGQSLCGSTCVNTSSDNGNCGKCGNVCPSAQQCQSGTCACTNGGTLCGTTCALTASDNNNCGKCGNVCSPGQTCTNGTCTCGTTSVSFSGAVQPIFTADCATNGCHGGVNPQQGLSLAAGKSYAQLVNVLASECKDGRKRVLPGNPSASYLVQKVTGVNMCSGSEMPKAGMGLAVAQTQLIANWICSGAPNN